MSQTILMIEDDVRLASMVAQYLEQAGYAVLRAADGLGGLAMIDHSAESPAPDLVVLDLMLPDIDGLEVCRRIRALPGSLSQLPVMMLTAKGDAMDRIIGLEIGADDYLPKPFEPRELLARIRAILRRRSEAPAVLDPTIRFGSLEM
jgi:DNA-binding response OmpR family regulator